MDDWERKLAQATAANDGDLLGGIGFVLNHEGISGTYLASPLEGKELPYLEADL